MLSKAVPGNFIPPGAEPAPPAKILRWRRCASEWRVARHRANDVGFGHAHATMILTLHAKNTANVTRVAAVSTLSKAYFITGPRFEPPRRSQVRKQPPRVERGL